MKAVRHFETSRTREPLTAEVAIAQALPRRPPLTPPIRSTSRVCPLPPHPVYSQKGAIISFGS
jgi:hypothetical protein